MSADKKIPQFNNYTELAEFWDTHSTADYWDEMEEVEFEFSPDARRRYLVAVDPSLLQRVRQMANRRGLATESLVNLLLEQRLRQMEAEAA